MMPVITPAAIEYLKSLLVMDPTNLGIRVIVDAPLTHGSETIVTYCRDGDHPENDHVLDYDGLKVFVQNDSLQYLDESHFDYVDMDNSPGGAQIVIKAPMSKPQPPGEDSELITQIQWVVDTDIAPMLAEHGGSLEIIETTKSNDVRVLFGGGCQGCAQVDVTVRQGVEDKLRERFPMIGEIIDTTDHSQTENAFY